ncbi:MAG: hypothetical protein MJ252_05845, partial [archaeon]|nr:hypothetical protein [archaeon]
ENNCITCKPYIIQNGENITLVESPFSPSTCTRNWKDNNTFWRVENYEINPNAINNNVELISENECKDLKTEERQCVKGCHISVYPPCFNCIVKTTFAYNGNCVRDCPPSHIKNTVTYTCDKTNVTKIIYDKFISEEKEEEFNKENEIQNEIRDFNYYNEKAYDQSENIEISLVYYCKAIDFSSSIYREGINKNHFISDELGKKLEVNQMGLSNIYNYLTDSGVNKDKTDILIRQIDFNSNNSDIVHNLTKVNFYDLSGNNFTLSNKQLEEINQLEIIISMIYNENSELMKLITEMHEDNVDIFDPNSPFFTDICFTYTTKNKRDISIKDRRTFFFPTNLCGSECVLIQIDFYSKKIECKCPFKFLSSPFEEQIKAYDSSNLDNYSIENIKAVKCFKNLYSQKLLSYNYVLIMLLAFFVINLVLLIFGYNNIKSFLKEFLTAVIYGQYKKVGKNNEEENKENKEISKIQTQREENKDQSQKEISKDQTQREENKEISKDQKQKEENKEEEVDKIEVKKSSKNVSNPPKKSGKEEDSKETGTKELPYNEPSSISQEEELDLNEYSQSYIDKIFGDVQVKQNNFIQNLEEEAEVIDTIGSKTTGDNKGIANRASLQNTLKQNKIKMRNGLEEEEKEENDPNFANESHDIHEDEIIYEDGKPKIFRKIYHTEESLETEGNKLKSKIKKKRQGTNDSKMLIDNQSDDKSLSSSRALINQKENEFHKESSLLKNSHLPLKDDIEENPKEKITIKKFYQTNSYFYNPNISQSIENISEIEDKDKSKNLFASLEVNSKSEIQNKLKNSKKSPESEKESNIEDKPKETEKIKDDTLEKSNKENSKNSKTKNEGSESKEGIMLLEDIIRGSEPVDPEIYNSEEKYESFCTYLFYNFKKREILIWPITNFKKYYPWFVLWSHFILGINFLNSIHTFFYTTEHIEKRYREDSVGFKYFMKNELFGKCLYAAIIGIAFKTLTRKFLVRLIFKLDYMKVKAKDDRLSVLKTAKCRMLLYLFLVIALNIILIYFSGCYSSTFINSNFALLLGLLFTYIFSFIICFILCFIISIFGFIGHEGNKCCRITYKIMKILF